jgi:hypothetical protein
MLPQLNVKVRNFGRVKEVDGVCFFNDAISFLNDFLISINDQTMLKRLTVCDGVPLPSDWSGKVDDEYGFSISDGKFVVKSMFRPVVKINYYAKKPIVTLTDEFPFDDSLISVAVLIASIYVINRAEGNTSIDQSLLDQRLEYLRRVRGA